MEHDRQDGFLGWAGRHPRWADVVCLLAIVLFAVFLRLVYVAEYTMSPLGVTAVAPDVAAHDAWARQILAGEAAGAPLYPRFLAMLYRRTGGALGAVRDLKLLLDTAALVLVWVAVRRLWRRRTACLAGLLWSAYLPLIYYSAELHPEGLTVFLVSLAFFLWSFATAATGRFRLALLGGVGLCLGLAAAAQPLLLPFAVGVAALGPWCLPGGATGRERLVAALILLVPGVLLAFSPLAGVAAGGEFVAAPTPLHNLAYAWSALEIPSGSDLPELQFYTPLMRLPFPRFGWIAPLAVLGVWLRRRDRRVWLWLLLPAVHTLALAFVALAGGRQRLPMLPALLVLAALGIDALVDAWVRRDVAVWRFATVLLLAVFVPIHLLRPPLPRDSAARSLLLAAEASCRLGNFDHAEQAAAKAAELAPDLPGIESLRELCRAGRERRADATPPGDTNREEP